MRKTHEKNKFIYFIWKILWVSRVICHISDIVRASADVLIGAQSVNCGAEGVNLCENCVFIENRITTEPLAFSNDPSQVMHHVVKMQ